MENELWRKVYQIVQRLGKNKRPRRATYNDADILLTYLWSVLHDRPVYWACQKSNWPIQQLMHKVEKELINQCPPRICRWIDAKPLPVSRNSKDKEAAYGYAESGMGKGYKLHAIADGSQGFVAWTVRPMNLREWSVADELIAQLDSEGYLIGDGGYDSNRLYDLAWEKSIQLIALRRYRKAKGLGHRPNSPHRLRALSLQETPMGQGLLASRNNIETMFAQLTNLGCGLSPLPNWVRSLFRVEMWVRGKMIIYNLWRQKAKSNAA
jgi:hypothetical protein